MENNNVDTDFASDMMDEPEEFSVPYTPDADLKDLYSKQQEWEQEEQKLAEQRIAEKEKATQEWRDQCRKRLEASREAMLKKNVEKTSESIHEKPVTENLNGTPESDKSVVDRVIDWSMENPVTAFLVAAGIGAIAYSINHNKEKAKAMPLPSTTRKRKHKPYKPLSEQEEEKQLHKEEIAESIDNQPEPKKKFWDTFNENFKKRTLTKKNKVKETVDTPNVVAAVTAAGAAAVVATKVSATVGGISAVVLAGIGYATQSPVMMIAGAGLAAGILVSQLLPKTVKSQALDSAPHAENVSTDTQKQTTVSGLDESSTKNNPDFTFLNISNKVLSEDEERLILANDKSPSPEWLNDADNPFNGHQAVDLEEPEIEFSDCM